MCVPAYAVFLAPKLFLLILQAVSALMQLILFPASDRDYQHPKPARSKLTKKTTMETHGECLPRKAMIQKKGTTPVTTSTGLTQHDILATIAGR